MIRKTLTYILIFFLLLYALQWAVNEGLRRNRKGVYEKYATLFLKQNHFDNLVLGSSRAEMHLDVALFDSLTGMHTFNAGVSGGTTRMAYTILKAYALHSSVPRSLIFECDFHISHLKTDTIFNFPRYFPYLGNPVLYDGFRQIDPRFRAFRYFPFCSLPYSGLQALGPALNGWSGRTGPYDDAYEQGFFRNTVDDHYDHVDAYAYDSHMHPETRQYLDSIIRFCQTRGCRLTLSMSPAYTGTHQEMRKREQIVKQYQFIADSCHLPLFDYSADTSICRHPQYFEDPYHLFYPGARLFTRKIAADFNNITR